MVQAMGFSEQTFKKSVNDAFHSLVRPVGSVSAAQSRGLALLKTLAAAPVTRDLLKRTGAGQLIPAAHTRSISALHTTRALLDNSSVMATCFLKDLCGSPSYSWGVAGATTDS